MSATQKRFDSIDLDQEFDDEKLMYMYNTFTQVKNQNNKHNQLHIDILLAF